MLNLTRIACTGAAVVLFALALFFAVIVAYLVSSEVMPAISEGSLNVETSTMILNVVWEGNEIYVLLTLYVVLAATLAWGGIRLLVRGFSKQS